MTQEPEFHYLRCPWGAAFTGMLLTAAPEGGVLIDTAFPEAIDGFLLPQLREFGFPLAALQWVINTHSHGDHAGGNARLRELCGVKFAIHPAGAANLEASGVRPDLQLEDGARLESAGLRFEIVHTPGHSPDSICVLEQTSGTLFTGDSLQGRGTVNSGIALYSDPEAYLRSIAKIETLSRQGRIRRILGGHAHAPFDGEVPEKEIPAFLAICRETVRNYARAAETYQAETPHSDAAEFGRRLLLEFGVTAVPRLPGLSKVTAQAHLAMDNRRLL